MKWLMKSLWSLAAGALQGVAIGVGIILVFGGSWWFGAHVIGPIFYAIISR